jgi:hypothetical protein
MQAKPGHVFLSVADDQALAKAHCLALPLTVPKTNAQLLHPFNATNTGRQVGAEKTAVGGFVGEPATSGSATNRADKLNLPETR